MGSWVQGKSRPVKQGRMTLTPGWQLLRNPGTQGVGGGRAPVLARRASQSWIVPPPLSCTRVGTAVCLSAESCPKLVTLPGLSDSKDATGICSATAEGWHAWSTTDTPGTDWRGDHRKVSLLLWVTGDGTTTGADDIVRHLGGIGSWWKGSYKAS
jgi:hypothetical protein